MPIYEYACESCGEHFETIVFSSDEQVCCPKCDSDKVQRQLSGFAVGGGGVGASIGQAGGGCGGGGGFS